MGPRTGLSTVLILGSIVLLIAIVVGNNMGNRVLGQIPERVPTLGATPLPSPTSSAFGNNASQALWKRRQVLSVATDPAFPDPRVTPEPPAPATPRPTPKPTPKPSPTPTSEPSHSNYTSPPLPIPLATGTEEAPTPVEQPSSTPIPRVTPTSTGRGGRTVLASPPPIPNPSIVP